ncbi:hypothetical protein KVF89_22400 [Nocardioides carbamazepini]|uniref:hypothetical protein n=1 Tax=Nocardioides carbamazepini TaxID=2854259 RepID=UPI002149DFBF|nr:hypothetical protein [Nocardioides carbamazepini]MCR1785308.1 hypothetical protein [Nocardioides carbamazepini]
MPRLRSVRTGAVVSCSEETAARLGSEWQPFDGTIPADDDKGYAGMTANELKAEIATRNAGRGPDAQLVNKGNKAALVAVLEQDDHDADAGGTAADDDEDPDNEGSPGTGAEPDED